MSVSKSASGPMTPAWESNLNSLTCWVELCNVAPATPCVSLPTLWPLPTSLKQVGPSPSLAPAWRAATPILAFLRLPVISGHPESLMAPREWIAQRFLSWLHFLGPSLGLCCRVFWFISLATLNILQGKGLCLFPCTHSLAPCKPISLLVLLSSNLSDPHQLLEGGKKWNFTQMCYKYKVQSQKTQVYMETKLKGNSAPKQDFRHLVNGTSLRFMNFDL